MNIIPSAQRPKAREYRYFRVKHANGTVSIVRGEEWQKALAAGRLFQSDELKKADPRLAEVASGLVCVVDETRAMAFKVKVEPAPHHNVRSWWHIILRAFLLAYNPNRANQYELDLMES